jgi:Flp pilus assembly protein TadD
VSVILDALRRRRREPTTESPTRGVPAGLGLTSAVSEVSRQRDRRFALMAITALIVLLGVWFGLRLNPSSAVTPLEPAQSAQPPVVSHPNQVPTAPAPQASLAPTPSPAPGVPNPAPKTPNPESRVPRPESRIPLPESRIPSTEPVDHFALAVRYQNLGNFEQAREHYLTVIARNAFNAEARNNLGLLYHGRGMTREAIDQFDSAIEINSRYVKARSNLAVVLTGAGRLAEARSELRAALDIEPHNSDLLVNMALVEKADQHAEQAIEILLHAIAVSPVHAAAHYNLAVLYDERGSLALAFDHYNAFLKHAGPERGELLMEVQRRLRAIEPRLHDATN